MSSLRHVTVESAPAPWGVGATILEYPYGDEVIQDHSDSWPLAGQRLVDELAASRGVFAIVAAGSMASSDHLVDRFRTDLGLAVARLGGALAHPSQPPSLAEIEAACGTATVIADIDVLMWPAVQVSPLQLLSGLARRRPTIAVWPGDVRGGRATYSAPGRPDYHDIALRGVSVLRPRDTRFPDEIPFTIERVNP